MNAEIEKLISPTVNTQGLINSLRPLMSTEPGCASLLSQVEYKLREAKAVTQFENGYPKELTADILVVFTMIAATLFDKLEKERPSDKLEAKFSQHLGRLPRFAALHQTQPALQATTSTDTNQSPRFTTFNYGRPASSVQPVTITAGSQHLPRPQQTNLQPQPKKTLTILSAGVNPPSRTVPGAFPQCLAASASTSKASNEMSDATETQKHVAIDTNMTAADDTHINTREDPPTDVKEVTEDMEWLIISDEDNDGEDNDFVVLKHD